MSRANSRALLPPKSPSECPLADEAESQVHHIGYRAGRVEPDKNVTQLSFMVGPNASWVVLFVETPKPLMAYRADHNQP